MELLIYVHFQYNISYEFDKSLISLWFVVFFPYKLNFVAFGKRK